VQNSRRPDALRPGDQVALVSPSGPLRPETLVEGIALLESWGLRVSVAPHAHARHGFLAGTDAERLADLNTALADPGIRGVVSTRGGYGAQRIADGLDLAAVRADPKVVVGFSDITALQLALWRGARLATVHGPSPRRLVELAPECAESMRRAVMTADPVVIAADPAEETAPVRVPGTARGTLLGGNLCLVAASLGTADMPDLTGAVLLLEEVQEPPYKVDRMLTHLRRAGALDRVAGIAVGQFTDCADEWPVSIVDVLTERLGDLGVPVLGGLPIGHGAGQLTVPVGVPAVLDAGAGTLRVEPAVRG
jgi:muramoyltetrapeptide carboxypeptidase